MKKITLSVNPTYLCNFRCNFCYLTDEELSDKKKMDLNIFERRLVELSNSGFVIEHVDLYGGEIGLLELSYLEHIDEILERNGDPTISINTNFLKVSPYFLRDHIDVSVSFDFKARQSSDIVLQNILLSKKEIAILILARPEVIKMNVDEMINTFNHIANIKTVEIKPYSSNQANQLDVADIDYEQFVKKWINSKIDKRFSFENINLIKSSLSRTRNAFSDDHLYITPEGKFAVLDFDEYGHEYFLTLESLNEYEAWVQREKQKILNNTFCGDCEYKGHCLTEHYRDVKSLNDSCSGFKNLLDWSKDHEQLLSH